MVMSKFLYGLIDDVAPGRRRVIASRDSLVRYSNVKTLTSRSAKNINLQTELIQIAGFVSNLT